MGQVEGVLENVHAGQYSPWTDRLVDWLLELLEPLLSLDPKARELALARRTMKSFFGPVGISMMMSMKENVG